MPLTLGDLGDLQLAVMKILWQRGSATVHEVLGDMTREPPPAYTTILTVLRNLEKRALVQHDEITSSRMYRYRPTIAAEELLSSVLTDVIDRIFDGSAYGLLVYLLENTRFTEAEYCEISHRITLDKRRVTGKDVSA